MEFTQEVIELCDAAPIYTRLDKLTGEPDSEQLHIEAACKLFMMNFDTKQQKIAPYPVDMWQPSGYKQVTTRFIRNR